MRFEIFCDKIVILGVTRVVWLDLGDRSDLVGECVRRIWIIIRLGMSKKIVKK